MPALAALAVNIERIVADAGVAIARNHQPDNPCASFAYSGDGRQIIGVNTAISPRRQRFAVAHAYAHLQLHSNRRPLIACRQIRVDGPGSGTSAPTSDMEQEANRWAGDILMPELLIRDELGRQVATAHDSRDQLIGRMAAQFEVSNEAMGWRLISLRLITG